MFKKRKIFGNLGTNVQDLKTFLKRAGDCVQLLHTINCQKRPCIFYLTYYEINVSCKAYILLCRGHYLIVESLSPTGARYFVTVRSEESFPDSPDHTKGKTRNFSEQGRCLGKRVLSQTYMPHIKERTQRDKNWSLFSQILLKRHFKLQI